MTNAKHDIIVPRFQAPRYTDRPFPPYRFIPGHHPHPTAHPDGHSFRPPGEPEPTPPFVPPHDWRGDESYLYGCDLYNHAYWWEAHEAWEAIWHLPPKGSAHKRYLQGIIQLAACHLKLLLGRLDGVERLIVTGREHLDAALALSSGPRFMGIDVIALRRRVDAYYARVLGDPSAPPRHHPARFPYLLPGDESPAANVQPGRRPPPDP